MVGLEQMTPLGFGPLLCELEVATEAVSIVQEGVGSVPACNQSLPLHFLSLGPQIIPLSAHVLHSQNESTHTAFTESSCGNKMD